MHKTEVHPFLYHVQENDFPSNLNVLLEKVLVCAQFSLKQAKRTYSLCFITQLFGIFGIL